MEIMPLWWYIIPDKFGCLHSFMNNLISIPLKAICIYVGYYQITNNSISEGNILQTGLKYQTILRY